jgi:uncharacterized phiE125 gp8 family phage protein
MAIRLITAPTVQPITLAQAKAHLRVDHDQDDDLITAYIAAASSHVDGKDGFLGRALVQQTWELVIDQFPCNEIQIPLPPLQEIVSVIYDNTAGAAITLAPTAYDVDTVSEPGWIVPAIGGWPTSLFDGINAVRIRYTAGYAPTTDSPPDLIANIPGAIKAAMLLHIGSLYAQRESILIGTNVMPLPWGAEQLLRRYRVWTAIG